MITLNMLNALHLAPALNLGLAPIYRAFPRCRLLPSLLVCNSSSLSRTFTSFWPRVATKATFGQVGAPFVFFATMACKTTLHLGFNTCTTTCSTCLLILVLTMHGNFFGGTFLGRKGMKNDYFVFGGGFRNA